MSDPVEGVAQARDLDSEEVESHSANKPWFVYPMLAAAITAVSTAPVAFASMAEVSPFLLACWRLQMTTLFVSLPGSYYLLNLSQDQRRMLLRQCPLILCSGVMMGVHFGIWVECIEHTSLTHALLVGSSPPIIIAIGSLIFRKPVSGGELIGTGIGAIGMVLMAQSAHSEKAVSLYGDLLGLLASCFFCTYLVIGRKVRQWMPLFAYVLPMNLLATVTTCLAALIREGATFNAGSNGVFHYFTSWSYFWRVAYLGFVPGVVGHVSFNALLKWLHPLIIALPGALEPPIGSLIGLALGVSTVPGLFTYLGGSILIVATVIVILASYQREKKEKLEQSEATKPTVAMTDISAELGDLAERAELKTEDEERISLIPPADRESPSAYR